MSSMGCGGQININLPMPKKRITTNTLWFVTHPYAAPPMKDFEGNICLWNLVGDGPHHRKLFECDNAIVVDNKLIAHHGQQMTFIGEWECCSSWKPNSNKGIFKRTHKPIHSPHDAKINCKNTDPYVCGKEFYWISCKQPTDISRIDIGDIVLFGTYTMKDRKIDQMVIDTVLVVDEIIPNVDFNSSRFTQCFRDVTLAHTLPGSCLIVGKMYDPNKSYQNNVPFSFVPCRRDRLMDKLVIPIPSFGGNPLKIGQNGGHQDLNNSVGAWKALVGIVSGAGCELGVYMPEPVLAADNAIINKKAKSIIKKPKTKKQNEKDTNPCGGSCPGSNC